MNAVRVLQSVRRGVWPADRQQLRFDRQQHAGTRDGRVPGQLGAGDGRRATNVQGLETGGGGVREHTRRCRNTWNRE